MSNEGKNTTLSLKCDQAFADKVKTIASQQGVSISEFIRGCIECGAGKWISNRKV